MNTSTDQAVTPLKRVLVVAYSQTGQLTNIVNQIIAPLQADSQIAVHVETLKPQPAYPFPWPFFRFFDAFPESIYMEPPMLASLSLKGDENFDLIILPYQVWYLAPSLPITGFLKHPVAKSLLAGKPVITVIACRNMWMMAQEKMKGLLDAVGARLVDNIVLTDPGSALATFITTARWMFTGRRNSFWGLLPAGVDAAQIQGTRRFGLALRDALLENQERGDKPLLAGLEAVHADPRLLISEKAGTRSFFLWGKLLRAAGKPGAPQRVPLLVLYFIFLIILIITVVPISLTLQTLARPLLRRRLAALKAKFELPSGSGTERMPLYDQ